MDSSRAAIAGAQINLLCKCSECPSRPCSECCPSGFSAEATSDEQGHFSIKNVPPGTYVLRGQAAGFKTVEVRGISVRPHASQSVELVFGSGGSVEVASKVPAVTAEGNDKIELQLKVFNRDTEKPLENAKITLLWQCECKKECPTKPCSECCPSEQVLVATTDSSGIIRFHGPAGIYRIGTDYGAYSKDTVVRVKDGDTEKVKIPLTMPGRPQ